MTAGDEATFFADNINVCGFDTNNNVVKIATAESSSWAELIAEALNNDADAYVV